MEGGVLVSGLSQSSVQNPLKVVFCLTYLKRSKTKKNDRGWPIIKTSFKCWLHIGRRPLIRPYLGIEMSYLTIHMVFNTCDH